MSPNSQIKLFVDDLRRCPDGWTLARTNTQAVRILATMPVDEVSLDHDIVYTCTSHQHCYAWNHEGLETFMPVAHYISLMPTDRKPTKIRIHTSNQVAGSRMADILGVEDYNYARDSMSIINPTE